MGIVAKLVYKSAKWGNPKPQQLTQQLSPGAHEGKEGIVKIHSRYDKFPYSK